MRPNEKKCDVCGPWACTSIFEKVELSKVTFDRWNESPVLSGTGNSAVLWRIDPALPLHKVDESWRVDSHVTPVMQKYFNSHVIPLQPEMVA